MKLIFGIICIIISIPIWYFFIYKFKKEDSYKEGYDNSNFRIYIGVIGLIFLGIMLIVDFFK